MELYSAINKIPIMNFVEKWVQLKNVMITEVTQTHKVQCYMFSFMCVQRMALVCEALVNWVAHSRFVF